MEPMPRSSGTGLAAALRYVLATSLSTARPQIDGPQSGHAEVLAFDSRVIAAREFRRGIDRRPIGSGPGADAGLVRALCFGTRDSVACLPSPAAQRQPRHLRPELPLYFISGPVSPRRGSGRSFVRSRSSTVPVDADRDEGPRRFRVRAPSRPPRGVLPDQVRLKGPTTCGSDEALPGSAGDAGKATPVLVVKPAAPAGLLARLHERLLRSARARYASDNDRSRGARPCRPLREPETCSRPRAAEGHAILGQGYSSPRPLSRGFRVIGAIPSARNTWAGALRGMPAAETSPGRSGRKRPPPPLLRVSPAT